jgi:DNA-binding NarL/FixJ family response regulator
MSEHGTRGADRPIRVAIVEDDDVTREGLRRLIQASSGYDCAGAFGSVEEALSRTVAPPPDVLLLDIGLPGMSGVEGVRALQQKYAASQPVMLTVYADEDNIFEAICNGACGYLVKETPPAKLLEAIADAHAGGAPMSREIARKVVTLFRKTSPRPKLEAQLSPQELRLVELLAEGYSYQGASSLNTIRNYIHAVYEKLHVHTKSEAVSKVMRSRMRAACVFQKVLDQPIVSFGRHAEIGETQRQLPVDGLEPIHTTKRTDPDDAGAILEQTKDVLRRFALARLVDRASGSRVFAADVQSAQAGGGGDPVVAPTSFEDIAHRSMRQSVRDGVVGERVAVKAGQPVRCAEPEEAT